MRIEKERRLADDSKKFVPAVANQHRRREYSDRAPGECRRGLCWQPCATRRTRPSTGTTASGPTDKASRNEGVPSTIVRRATGSGSRRPVSDEN
jgi:hypothetical protein